MAFRIFTSSLARHVSQLSFAEAASELERLKGVRVSAATARRRTEADGAVYAALQDRDAKRGLALAPPARQGPALQQVSVDGAMVPLVDGSWREVRTLVIGTVAPGPQPGTVRCADRSYFSRLADAATFTTLAAGEVQRRGVETAGRVLGVVDGAAWCQHFLDAHRPDAVRILDFPHAAQRLSDVAEAVWGTSERGRGWAREQRAELRDGTAERVLAAIRALPVAAAPDPALAARVQGEVLGYLEPRREQLRYAAFRAQGWPIGSGAVESANKVVVEARLKGAGRRWSARQVTPMVALRGALCSERWDEAWSAIAAVRQAHAHRAQPAGETPVATSVASAASVAVPAHRHRPASVLDRLLAHR